MALETATYVKDLNPINPPAGDPVSQADDHLRLIKSTLTASFPKIGGAMTRTANDLNSACPTGLISIWYGPPGTIPAGWAVCDGGTYPRNDGTGNIVTPALGGKFVLAAGPNHLPSETGGNPVGSITLTTSAVGDHVHAASTDTQGLHAHGGWTGGTTLSLDQLPAHGHGVPTNLAESGQSFAAGGDLSAAQLVGGTQTTFTSYNTGSGQPHAHVISSGGAHSHNVSMSGAGGHSHTITVSSAPSYFALYYIMRL